MNGNAVFLWGALGGAFVQFEFLWMVISDARSQPTNVKVSWRAGLMTAAGSIVFAGIMTFLVAGGLHESRPAVPLFIGFGAANLSPFVGRFMLGTAASNREPVHVQPRADAPESADVSRSRELLRWWTADRVRTLLMAGAFVLALLTYLK